jgi:hypothetical protein
MSKTLCCAIAAIFSIWAASPVLAQAPAVSGPVVAPTDCSASLEAAKKAGDEATALVNKAKTTADQSTQSEKNDVDVCATGYITMEKNHIALDLPEFKMVDQKISFDVPQVTIKQQHIKFGTPSVECKNVKTGQYPEVTCHDTWITVGPVKTKGVPACTTKWSDIITTQCFPIITQQDIVMGVPEFKVATTSFVLGIPEITMKRQDWYFDLPKFNMTSGCFGEGCKQKCDAAAQKLTDKYQGILQPAVNQARISVATKTHDSLQCQRGVATAQKDTTLASIDANIAVVKSSLAQVQAMGAGDQAASISKTLNDITAMRQKVADQFDAQIASLDDADKKAAGQIISSE